MTINDLTNFSKEAHDSLIKKFNGLRYEGLFTPPSIKGTLNLPGTIGGSEWGGAAYDPGRFSVPFIEGGVNKPSYLKLLNFFKRESCASKEKLVRSFTIMY